VILDMLLKLVWQSTLDLVRGYWQIPVQEEDIKKTAYIMQHGMYKFMVMPFGLTNMLASFQWDMDVVLSGLNWVLTLVYINDIIVFSRTFEDHLGHLQEVFQQLWAANMYMKPSKCNFCQHELLFLGHIMHKDSIMANPEKLHAIQVMTRPANIMEVHVFLGLCNYYCWFMLDFAQLVDTLYCLTSRSVEQHFMWVVACDRVFNQLKKQLMSPQCWCSPTLSSHSTCTLMLHSWPLGQSCHSA
jgi:hypothetical protein